MRGSRMDMAPSAPLAFTPGFGNAASDVARCAQLPFWGFAAKAPQSVSKRASAPSAPLVPCSTSLRPRDGILAGSGSSLFGPGSPAPIARSTPQAYPAHAPARAAAGAAGGGSGNSTMGNSAAKISADALSDLLGQLRTGPAADSAHPRPGTSHAPASDIAGHKKTKSKKTGPRHPHQPGEVPADVAELEREQTWSAMFAARAGPASSSAPPGAAGPAEEEEPLFVSSSVAIQGLKEKIVVGPTISGRDPSPLRGRTAPRDTDANDMGRALSPRNLSGPGDLRRLTTSEWEDWAMKMIKQKRKKLQQQQQQDQESASLARKKLLVKKKKKAVNGKVAVSTVETGPTVPPGPTGAPGSHPVPIKLKHLPAGTAPVPIKAVRVHRTTVPSTVHKGSPSRTRPGLEPTRGAGAARLGVERRALLTSGVPAVSGAGFGRTRSSDDPFVVPPASTRAAASARLALPGVDSDEGPAGEREGSSWERGRAWGALEPVISAGFAADEELEEEEEGEGVGEGEEENEAADLLARGESQRGSVREVQVMNLLREEGMSEADLEKFLLGKRAPTMANPALLLERLSFLRNEVGFTASQLSALLALHPRVLAHPVSSRLKPHVEFLRGLGVPAESLPRVLRHAPKVFDYSIERALAPRIQFLQEEVGIREEQIGSVVVRSPQVLTQSIKGGLLPRLHFFRGELGIPLHSFAHMVTRHPQLLHYSLEQGIKPRVHLLLRFGMTLADVALVLQRCPQVLSLSIDNTLVPKFEYLVQRMGGTVKSVVSFPAFFSLSLENRIKPRHLFMLFMRNQDPRGEEQGLRNALDDGGLSSSSSQCKFPLSWLALKDEQFCLRLGEQTVEQYHYFVQEMEKSSQQL